MGLNEKAPVLAGAFLIAVFSLADWVKLVCQVYLVLNEVVRWFGGLTGFWAVVVCGYLGHLGVD